MPGSLSQISRRGTRPSCWISSHDPNSRSSVFRVGIIRPIMNRECAAVITSTGNNVVVPSSSGIFLRREPQVALRRITRPPRSAGRPDQAGDAPDAAGGTLSRNHVIDPVQPTRSASTVAGMSGCSASIARTRASNGVNDVGTGARSYFGGRPTPPPARPSPCRSRDPARPAAAEPHPPPAAGSTPNPPPRSPNQSVWVASFSSVATASFSSVVDTENDNTAT